MLVRSGENLSVGSLIKRATITAVKNSGDRLSWITDVIKWGDSSVIDLQRQQLGSMSGHKLFCSPKESYTRIGLAKIPERQSLQFCHGSVTAISHSVLS